MKIKELFKKRAVTEYPINKYNAYKSAFSEMFGTNSISGAVVNEINALKIPAFNAAVKVISQTVANMPLDVYSKAENNSREKVKDHPLNYLLHIKPNDLMVAYNFKELLVRQIILKGNSYIYIIRKEDMNGTIEGLFPLLPDYITIERDSSGQPFYSYSAGSKVFRYTPENIAHIPSISEDGLTGVSVLSTLKDVLEQAIVIEEFTLRFFGKGVNSNLYLEFEGNVPPPDERGRNLIRNLFRREGGYKNAGVPITIPSGTSIKELSNVNLRDSQLLELKQYTIQQIARGFNLPPHILQELSKSSFSNIYQMNKNILTYAIEPYLSRIEAVLNASLLNRNEQDKYYIEFNRDSLLQSDPKDKAENVRNLVYGGIMTVNEGRKLYNLPSVDGGDELLVEANRTTLDNAIKGESTD